MAAEPEEEPQFVKPHQLKLHGSHLERRKGGKVLVVKGYLNNAHVRIMIDSGATGCFAKKWFRNTLNEKELSGVQKINISLADKSIIHGEQFDGFNLEIGDFKQKITLALADIAYDVILGIDWLEEHNPIINWEKRTLSFGDHLWTAVPDEELAATDKETPKLMSLRAFERVVKRNRGDVEYGMILLNQVSTSIDKENADEEARASLDLSLIHI